MDWRVSFGIVCAGLFMIYSILRAVIQKKVSESQGLLWLIPGIIIVVGGIFPELVIALAKQLNVSYAPSLAFLLALLIAYYLLFWCTMWIGNLSLKMQALSIQVSLLDQENKELKKQLDEQLDTPKKHTP